MTFSDAVKTVTRETIVPMVSDTVLKGNVFLLRTLGRSKSWKSGYQYDIPIKYKKSTVGGVVGIGGTLDTDRQETRVKMSFQPQRIHKPVVIDDIEAAVNQGDERVLELLSVEMDSIAQDLMDDCGDYLYAGTGASGSSFDSILNAADDSTNFASYGGQTRSTYTTIKGYYVASVGALALSDLSTAYDAVEIGGVGPSLIVTTPTTWSAYEALLQPTVRAGYQTSGFPQVTRTGVVSSTNALSGGDIGFNALWYRGTAFVKDEKCTAQKLFMLNENNFFWAGLDLPDYEKINTSARNIEGPQALPIPKGFNWSGMLRSTSQPAEVGHMYLVGNWMSDDPRRLGQCTGITG
jgi:hypothetical protein